MNDNIHEIPYSENLYRCWKCNQVLKEKDNKLVVVDGKYLKKFHEKKICNFEG